MTPREVVQRAVEFRGPARLAINGFGDLSDCVWIGPELIKPPQAADDGDGGSDGRRRKMVNAARRALREHAESLARASPANDRLLAVSCG
jgi:hypothetical protein